MYQLSGIPEILVEILYMVGFDNPVAVKNITTKNIKEMKNYVTENCKDSLANSVYDGMDKFGILPRHKAILLSLPPYIE